MPVWHSPMTTGHARSTNRHGDSSGRAKTLFPYPSAASHTKAMGAKREVGADPIARLRRVERKRGDRGYGKAHHVASNVRRACGRHGGDGGLRERAVGACECRCGKRRIRRGQAHPHRVPRLRQDGVRSDRGCSGWARDPLGGRPDGVPIDGELLHEIAGRRAGGLPSRPAALSDETHEPERFGRSRLGAHRLGRGYIDDRVEVRRAPG